MTPSPPLLEALSEAAKLLQSAAMPEELLGRLLDVVVDCLDVPKGVAALRDEENMSRIVAVRGVPGLSVGAYFNELVVSAVGVNLLLPIGEADSPLGVFGLEFPPERGPSAKEEEFLSAVLSIAESGVAGVDTRRKARSLDRTLEQKVQDLRALLDVVRGLTASLEPDDVARLLVLTLAGRWASPRYALAAWKDGHPTVMRWKGLELPELEDVRPLLDGLPEVVAVEVLPDGPVKAALLAQQGTVLFPIRSANGLIGVLVFGPRLGRQTYGEGDLEFGAGLVAQAAVAFENSWYFAETVQRKKIEAVLRAQRGAEVVFSALADVMAGLVLDGKYRLETKIGAGGFGAVYRALHLALDRPVAVKIFRPIPGNETAEGLERLRLEGISACRITHSNAVTVLDFGVSEPGIAYLVMELLQGHTLATELRRRKRLSPGRCAAVLAPICSVLAEAHKQGIVHRDIKPDNIFLHRTKDGEVVKVVDFGLAKIFDKESTENQQRLTMQGALIGTPAYLAPERLMNNPYDGRADVYSLGVMVYEMLCGHVPFSARDGNLYTLGMMHLRDEPRPPRTVLPDLPLDLDALVMRMLHKNPARRPTAEEVGEAFSALVGLEDSDADFMETAETPLDQIEGLTDTPSDSTVPTEDFLVQTDTETMTMSRLFDKTKIP